MCHDMARQSNGYFVSEMFTGHGIGHKLHMPPMVHHVPNSEKTVMQVGNVFTIEPIVVFRKPWEIKWWDDGFTVTATSLPSGIYTLFMLSPVGTHHRDHSGGRGSAD